MDLDSYKNKMIDLLERGLLSDLQKDNTVIHTFIKVYTYLGKDCNYLKECTKIVLLDEKLNNIIKERLDVL